MEILPSRCNDQHILLCLQTVPTLAFKKFRGEITIGSTNCRVCKQNETESVKHILSHCGAFLNTFYKRRHDLTLQYILFNFLVKMKMVEVCPPWYSKSKIKPMYENEDILLLWDVPEYNGREDEIEENILRPDAKIIFKKMKKIFIIEQSVPWISNRENKMEEKIEKYKNIIRSIKLNNIDHTVEQITIIVDCLGGYSDSLKENMRKLGFTKSDQSRILKGVQKIILTEARSTINHFKLLTNL